MSNLDEIFAKAAEIAKNLPENLQESAFNRALDELLGGASGKQPAIKKTDPGRRATSKRKISAGAGRADDFVDSIDRTKYPDIGDTNRTADRALKILQLANEDFGIDGLPAHQIATILTKKFRLSTTANAVLMALQRESQTVDVRSGPDGKIVFHIMAPGEDYLARLRAGAVDPVATRGPKAPKKNAARKSKIRKETSTKKQTGTNAGKRRSSSLGPKAAIEKLVEAGFFAQPRQIAAIQEELKHSRGHTFTVQELSPTLLRCVRDETLSRSRTDSGQYEYTKA